jgi:tryptophan 2,3-dioxygenase
VTTTGEPQQLTYSEYLKVPELLQQQTCLADPAAHDELQFIIVHQVYELWFKLLRHETAEIHCQMRSGSDTDLRNAIRLCRRVEAIFKVLVGQIHVLESMRPADFLKFRSALNPASGFQSVQFREVETAFGLCDEQLASFTKNDPRHEDLLKAMQEESISDSLYQVLRDRGLGVTSPGKQRTPEQDEETMAALKLVYDSPDKYPMVYDLCEALVDIDEQLILWRRHHVMMVERQIGDKPGTGKGTTGKLDGIRYLQTTLMRRAFPDLWSVRTLLSD